MKEFNLKTFEKYCKANQKSFLQDKPYLHIDNGIDSKVLLVAHLDSVCKYRKSVMTRIHGKEYLYQPTLDDRLGVYTIMALLPKLGIIADILLTTGEESCNSTARIFETTKDYNWIASFDRGGGDVVMYQHKHNTELKTALSNVGFKDINGGSYSDICELSLGCGGFNVGVGMYDYHTIMSRCDLKEYFKQVELFCDFFEVYEKTSFPETGVINWLGYGNMFSGISETGWPENDKNNIWDNEKVCKLCESVVDIAEYVCPYCSSVFLR